MLKLLYNSQSYVPLVIRLLITKTYLLNQIFNIRLTILQMKYLI